MSRTSVDYPLVVEEMDQIRANKRLGPQEFFLDRQAVWPTACVGKWGQISNSVRSTVTSGQGIVPYELYLLSVFSDEFRYNDTL